MAARAEIKTRTFGPQRGILFRPIGLAYCILKLLEAKVETHQRYYLMHLKATSIRTASTCICVGNWVMGHSNSPALYRSDREGEREGEAEGEDEGRMERYRV